MKGGSVVFFLCLLIIFEIGTPQLASYGSSSGGGGLSGNRGVGGGGAKQGGGGFNRGSGGFVAQGSSSGGGGGGGGDGSDHQGLDWLRDSVPGEPGVDYPIFGLPVPDSSFSCDGRVEGGYYSDTELQCQAFQICVHDSVGGLVKYSFLCPNGSLFDQQYFVCDYWFNVDCSQAESLYGLNEEIAAERESNIGAVASDSGIGVASGRGGQSGNSFNGRGANSGNRGSGASSSRGSGASSNRGGNRRPASKQPSTGYLGPRNTRDLELDDYYEEDEEKQSSDYAYDYNYEE